MFQTSSPARDPVRSDIAGKDQHIWSYIRLATPSRPWFYVCYQHHAGEFYSEEAILLGSVGQIAEFLQQTGNSIQLEYVMLASPKHLNGSTSWKLECLSEVWRGRRKGSTEDVFVYHLTDGTRYVDCWKQTPLDQLIDLGRLIVIPQ